MKRTPNLNPEIIAGIEKKLDMKLVDTSKKQEGEFSPEDLLDYIYAVLHSPTYRETYKEFLKIDFPRIPYPESAETFWKLVEKGRVLRELHLMESPLLAENPPKYMGEGDNSVEKPVYTNGNVYINPNQYFENVPESSWNFYIGGYQPAQKWLKDRKGKILSFEDIRHYQKIIVAMRETKKVMEEIDTIFTGE